MGDWLVRWRRHAARHALMARAALAALHVERKRALNSWQGACEDADYVHARLRAAGGLLVERARAKPFRTWKRQQQQGAKARFIMQRRLNSELFGAAMLWRAVAADAVVAGRLMELAIRQCIGSRHRPLACLSQRDVGRYACGRHVAASLARDVAPHVVCTRQIGDDVWPRRPCMAVARARFRLPSLVLCDHSYRTRSLADGALRPS